MNAVSFQLREVDTNVLNISTVRKKFVNILDIFVKEK